MDSLRSVQPSKMNSRKLLAVSTFNFTKRLNVKVKAQLEELKTQKKTSEPILTADEKASALNEAEIKGTGFIMEMTCSDKGRKMIED